MAGAGDEQHVRFCQTPHGRLAYATIGDGPLLVMPALWIGHLGLEWEWPRVRDFVCALAADHRVVRYDRLGTGLSDRPAHRVPLDLDTDVAVLEALVDDVGGGGDGLSLLGVSFGGCLAAAYAARHPERVRRLVVFGTYARGVDLAPPELRQAIAATIRAHWGTGSRTLADIWLPGADTATRRDFADLQRAATSADFAADALEAVYAADIGDELDAIRAPTTVLHRRGDRATPFALGRDLAARIPGARFVSLAGDVHLPWLGEQAVLRRALREGLGVEAPAPAAPAPAAADDDLSDREREVLRLVADGLTDAAIAERLVLSPHTVHRHVANIRLKLGQPSRGAAAADAVRRGLI